MNRYFLYFLCFVLSFLLTGLYRKFALKKAILDVPNERSSHSVPTPRGGGLAIVIAFYLGVGYLFFKGDMDQKLFFALLTGIILVITGLFDDILSLTPLLRFSIQILVSGLAIYILGGLQTLELGFAVINQPILLSIVAIIGMVWFINLYNFIDGIDGYAGMQAVFVGLAIYFFTKSTTALILAIATLGFMPWNWQKAKIFMGDAGSTMLGFVIAVLGIYYQNTGSFSLVFWLVVTALFWFDASFTLFLRWKNKEKLSEAHRKHLYQRLVRSGWSHQQVVLLGLGLNLLLFCIVFITKIVAPEMLIVSLAFTLLVLFAWSWFVEKRFAFKKA
ncbi:MAG: MraY family glycosyltransferase [Cyclobacteriaceae bacterium]